MGDRDVARVIERALVDPGFFRKLCREPETVLTEFDLSQDERATFLKALRESSGRPAAEAAKAIRLHFVDRRAT
jgi:hypothetical protein